MQPLPQLESCLRLAFEARDPRHPSGISLASWFVRAPTRGRRRGELDAALLFPPEVREGLGPAAGAAIALAMDPGSWRSSASPRATIPVATREWLAEAAVALGRSEGFELAWAMLRAISELESTAQRLLGSRTPGPGSTHRDVCSPRAKRYSPRRWPDSASSRCSRTPRASGAAAADRRAASPLPSAKQDSALRSGFRIAPTIWPSGCWARARLPGFREARCWRRSRP